MSNEGKILMLRVQSNEHTAVTLQCFFEAEPALNKPDCVQFSHATKGTIFAFVGNYLCWIVGKFPQIKVVPISQDANDVKNQRTINL